MTEPSNENMSPLMHIAQDATKFVVSRTNSQGEVATVVITEDDLAVSVFGNVSSMARLSLAICNLAMSNDRPECPNCAAAWDRLMQAKQILLQSPQGQCS